ncbi:MAG: hypothetical protein ACYSU1_08670, partial [Planctomycetota bacterium]
MAESTPKKTSKKHVSACPEGERTLALRTTLLPKDTNPTGTIFGGVILSQIDQAGEIPLRRIKPHRRYVTVAMDS